MFIEKLLEMVFRRGQFDLAFSRLTILFSHKCRYFCPTDICRAMAMLKFH